MKTSLPFMLVIGLLVTCLIPTHAQDKETINIMEGKWKLEMMRDTLGDAMDIAHTKDPESEPDIYTNIDVRNKKKAILAAGKTTFNTSWEISGKLLSFYLRKKDKWVTYPIRSLNSDMIVIVYTILTDDGPMKIEAYYRKE
jgi:hypothetical protein